MPFLLLDEDRQFGFRSPKFDADGNEIAIRGDYE